MDSGKTCKRNERSKKGALSSLPPASMTLEAAMILPLFLFFMMGILSVFDMVLLQSSVSAALFRAGREAAEYAWYYRYALGEGGESDLPAEAVSSGLTMLWIGSRVNELVQEEDPVGRTLAGPVTLIGSQVLDRMVGIGEISLQSTYAGHAWTGYRLSETEDKTQEEEDEIVYVTDTGRVYHRSRACTYLQPSVRSVQGSLVSGERSLGGAVYHPCEYCRPSPAGTVFITSYGNRYHSSSSCSAIHRNIREVPLKSVEGRMRPCSKCG